MHSGSPSDPENDSPSQEDHGERERARRDASDLKRGVLVNFSGYLLRLALPALNILSIRIYGPELFGTFVVAQVTILLLWRAGSLGLDKAAVWWVSRGDDESSIHGLRAMLFWSVACSVVLAAIVALAAAPMLARWSGNPEAVSALRWMAAGLVPMAVMEMSIHAIMGTRRMSARVYIRDGLVPFLQVASAVTLGWLGWTTAGLQISFVVAMSAGAIAAVWMAIRVLGAASLRGPILRVPPAVRRYAGPIWMSELSGNLLSRMDVYVLAKLMDARAVGIYAAVMQIANTLRSVRQSFDPIVLALCSDISRRHEPRRLVEGLSSSTVAIMSIQIPVWAFLFCFDAWIIPLFGEGFEPGMDAMLILAGCWTLNGVFGLNGVGLLGYGRSELVLGGVILTIATQAALLFGLIPSFGIDGAAWAVALSYVGLSVLQWLQLRWIAGVNPYDARVARAVWTGAVALGLMLAIWTLLEPYGEAVRRIGAFAVFVLIGGLLYAWWMRARGRDAEVATA